MENQTTELEQIRTNDGSVFSIANFEHAQRQAKAICSSSLVPKEYLNNVPNTLIALDIANRIGASPLMVMQHLYIVHGKPSWSSTFLIAAINSSGKFKAPLRFEVSGDGDNKGCIAWTIDNTGEKLESPRVTMAMAKAEGWVDKNGSKWKTMPELMMRYRSASFFSRLFCPEITMGMQTSEEIMDVEGTVIESKPLTQPVNEEETRILSFIETCDSLTALESLEKDLKKENDIFKFTEAVKQKIVEKKKVLKATE